MTRYLVQCIEIANTTSGERCSGREDAEKTLLQLEWIEPHGPWRALRIVDDKIVEIGLTDYQQEKGRVIWKQQ